MSLPALLATVVEWGELGKTVAAALITGIGISVCFAIAILGMAQVVERRRQGEAVAAVGAAVLAAAALVVCAAGIVIGMIVMVSD